MQKEEIPERSRRENKSRDSYEKQVVVAYGNARGVHHPGDGLYGQGDQAAAQAQLAQLVGVSRYTISSIETGQFNLTAKLALVLCIAPDKKFEALFTFD